MNSLDAGLRRLGEILADYLAGAIDENTAGNAAVIDIGDLEDALPAPEKRTSRERLLARAFWATEQLREEPRYRTRMAELQYLLECLQGKVPYDEDRANAFYEESESDA